MQKDRSFLLTGKNFMHLDSIVTSLSLMWKLEIWFK